MADSGALIIQAHPFREAAYIDHIRLFPCHIHGVEIENACRTESQNRMAKLYAEHYGFLEFAGTDNHIGSRQKQLAGICTDQPVCDVEDFIEKVKGKKTKIFTIVNE
ncbi:MAG: hypothetical protein E7384_08065 [Ruminococcaceae bacterium]|nr:hypothetical protein [Oscillospiraceae bacterium]